MKTATPFVLLPLQQLFESPTNPRRMFDAHALEELTASVRDHGVLQPILVRLVHADVGEPDHEIVVGARRYRAAKAAGLLEIPALVRELTDKQVLELQFVENVQRSDLHPLDEGDGFRRLVDEHGYAVEDLAARVGKSRGYVYGRMQLARMPTDAQTLFVEGALDVSHAHLISRIPVPEMASKAAKQIAAGDGKNKPMTFLDAAEFVRRSFMCSLEHAPFSTRDKKLVDDAGACGSCPKRTGCQRDLFEGALADVGADVCTDPTCYARKTKAQFRRRKEEVLAAGGRVLEGREAKGVHHGIAYEFVDPEGRCHDDTKSRRWKDLVAEWPPVVLIEGRDGECVERFDRAAVVAAAIANGHAFLKRAQKEDAAREEASERKVEQPKVPAKTPEDYRIESEIEKRYTERVAAQVGAAARRNWKLALRWLAAEASRGGVVTTLERFGLKGIDWNTTVPAVVKKVGRWDAAGCVAFLMETMAGEETHQPWFAELAKALKVPAAATRKAVEKEVRAEVAEEAKGQGAKAMKRTSRAKRSTDGIHNPNEGASKRGGAQVAGD